MAGNLLTICLSRNARNKPIPGTGLNLGQLLTELGPAGQIPDFANSVTVHENEDGSYFIRFDFKNGKTGLMTIDPGGGFEIVGAGGGPGGPGGGVPF